MSPFLPKLKSLKSYLPHSQLERIIFQAHVFVGVLLNLGGCIDFSFQMFGWFVQRVLYMPRGTSPLKWWIHPPVFCDAKVIQAVIQLGPFISWKSPRMTCKLTPKRQRLVQHCRWNEMSEMATSCEWTDSKWPERFVNSEWSWTTVTLPSMEPTFPSCLGNMFPIFLDWSWGPKVPRISVDVTGQHPGTNKSMEFFGYLKHSCWVNVRWWPKIRWFFRKIDGEVHLWIDSSHSSPE